MRTGRTGIAAITLVGAFAASPAVAAGGPASQAVADASSRYENTVAAPRAERSPSPAQRARQRVIAQTVAKADRTPLLAAAENNSSDGAGRTGAPSTGEAPAEMKLPPSTVFGEPSGPVAESLHDAVGPYNQPAWTARNHRFSTTRAYVLPPWTVQTTFWTIGEFNDGTGPAYELQEEIEIGLPGRFQLDFYFTQVRGPDQDSFHEGEHKVELRWALADWGEIPLNPTAYVEWEQEGHSDAVEYKLLLAENLGPRWHWASNLVYEQSYSDDRETELAWTNGLSYTVMDPELSIGLEQELVRATADGARNPSDAEWQFLIGPSVEWRPVEPASIVLAPLAGIGRNSPDMSVFLLFEWSFGGPGGGGGFSGPTATESR